MVSLVITIIVLLILAAIVFLSSIKTINEADYSKYVSNVSDVSTAFHEASTAVNGDKTVESQTKSIEQIYNYVAKDGIEEKDFLTRSEVPVYTIIKDEGQIGIRLPEMIVESGTGKRVPVKYATTKNGKIFTWPPYDYENKYYITDFDTVDSKMQTEIVVGDEKFTIKIDPIDGSLLDAPTKKPEDDKETPDENLPEEHDFSSKTPTTDYLCSEATCTTPARYYYKCIQCNEKGTETYTSGNALGHNYGEWKITKTTTCATIGEKTKTCSRCGEVQRETIAKDTNNHTGGETPTVVDATCLTNGTKTYKCNSCGVIKRTETIVALGHSWSDFSITTEATCVKKGIKTRTCVRCKISETEEIPIDTENHSNDVEKPTTAATCTVAGKIVSVCSLCKVTLNTETIAALGHLWSDFSITTEATCVKKGVKTRTCERCKISETEEIPINGENHHDSEVEKTTTDATCIEDGKIVSTCSLCKVTLNTETIEALGHIDENSDGKCDRCGIDMGDEVQSELSRDYLAEFVTNEKPTSIVFVSDGVPNGLGTSIKQEDVSKEKNGGIIAWIDGATCYVGSINGGKVIAPSDANSLFSGLTNEIYKTIINIDCKGLDTSNVMDTSYMFSQCESLISINLSGVDTSKVTTMEEMFGSCKALTSLDVSGFDTSKVTNMSWMFENCSNLDYLDVSKFDVSSVYSIAYMFLNCSKLTYLDVTGFDTINVSAMGGAFKGCSSLKSLDVSGFKTDKVLTMGSMFDGCKSLTKIDASGFDTSNVADMSAMFMNCNLLTELDVSNFNTSNVLWMHDMFNYCESLTTLDVSNFNTSKVTSMQKMFYNCCNIKELDVSGFKTNNLDEYGMIGMFSYCKSITSLDLCGFNTSTITNMKKVFMYCTNLKTIYVSITFVTTNVTDSSDMFYGCTALVGGEGTVYDTSYTDATYARIDNGTETPGYFTTKTPCVTPDTLVTLADGTKKRIDETTYEDKFIVWDFVNGCYTIAPASIIMNHGYNNYNVVTLNFSDGTNISTINGHGFFHTDSNRFVILDNKNVQDYVGHDFAKQNYDGYSIVKLVSYSVEQQYTESWSILTSNHYNCIMEDMFTLTPAEVDGSPDYLMPFVIGDDMKYSEEEMQADVEKYGLYTYEEFAHLLTKEQFDVLNIPNFKVAVGKGLISYEEILLLIKIHMK